MLIGKVQNKKYRDKLLVLAWFVYPWKHSWKPQVKEFSDLTLCLILVYLNPCFAQGPLLPALLPPHPPRAPQGFLLGLIQPAPIPAGKPLLLLLLSPCSPADGAGSPGSSAGRSLQEFEGVTVTASDPGTAPGSPLIQCS